jgi:opine dehydrogenase
VETIAIVGGGHVGMTLLADLVSTRELHGKEAVLLPHGCREADLDERIAPWLEPITMRNIANGRRSEVRLERGNFAAYRSRRAIEILAAARYIVVTVPDIPSVRLALLRRLVEQVPLAGKILIMVRAGQSGQPVLAELVRSRPELRESSVVLVEDSFYGTRAEPGDIAFKRKLSVNVSVYAKDRAAALDATRELFPLGGRIDRPSWPDLAPRDGIELLFDPLGYYIHAGVALYPPNLARTRAGIRYTHYIDGIDRTLAGQLSGLDRERTELAAAYGASAQRFPRIIERQYGLPARPDFFEMMQSCRDIYKSLSCGSLDELASSRLLLEDLPALHTIEWLAAAAGLELPLTKAYAARTWETVESLGLDLGRFDGYRDLLGAVKAEPEHIVRLLNDPHSLNGSTR